MARRRDEGGGWGGVALLGLALAGGWMLTTRRGQETTATLVQASPRDVIRAAPQIPTIVAANVARDLRAGADMFWRALAYTRKTESGAAGYAAMNLNRDRAGLSFGLIQWAQAPGSLGELLQAMYEADPIFFNSAVDGHADELLATTNSKVSREARLAPVAGFTLWDTTGPWPNRFLKLASDPNFQQVQLREAREKYGSIADATVEALGVPTERAYVLAFDSAVQHGNGAAKAARAVRDAGKAGQGQATLAAFIDKLTLPYFRPASPTPPGDRPSSEGRWIQHADQTWHWHKGDFDLYLATLNRKRRILADSSLSDGPGGLTA